jgi:surface carbohydrate biosynthesis protein
MQIERLIRKLKSFYINFLSPPRKWHKLKRADVLIYDSCGADNILPYLTNYSTSILHLRGENINFPCFLRAIFKSTFWNGNPIQAYAETFIYAVSPKVIITFIDNNICFYEISKRYTFGKTIFIQNGSRSMSGDVIESLVISNKYHVDYMLVHGSAIGNLYLKYISGKSINIGSLKNNEVKKENNINKGVILFVSQWHKEPDIGSAFYIEADGTPVYWNAFFKADVMVLEFLDKWCVENNKKLLICGRELANPDSEKLFFANRLKICDWEYVKRANNHSAYKLVDTAEIVVFIDSTLGYESIARGKKTASFSCRMSDSRSNFNVFGWPAQLPNNGPFWTNEQNDIEFQRIMSYLNNLNCNDWEKVLQHYKSKIMDFDPGNTRLVALLEDLLASNES